MYTPPFDLRSSQQLPLRHVMEPTFYKYESDSDEEEHTSDEELSDEDCSDEEQDPSNFHSVPDINRRVKICTALMAAKQNLFVDEFYDELYELVASQARFFLNTEEMEDAAEFLRETDPRDLELRSEIQDYSLDYQNDHSRP